MNQKANRAAVAALISSVVTPAHRHQRKLTVKDLIRIRRKVGKATFAAEASAAYVGQKVQPLGKVLVPVDPKTNMGVSTMSVTIYARDFDYIYPESIGPTVQMPVLPRKTCETAEDARKSAAYQVSQYRLKKAQQEFELRQFVHAVYEGERTVA